jgi:hypothetical protein
LRRGHHQPLHARLTSLAFGSLRASLGGPERIRERVTIECYRQRGHCSTSLAFGSLRASLAERRRGQRKRSLVFSLRGHCSTSLAFGSLRASLAGGSS